MPVLPKLSENGHYTSKIKCRFRNRYPDTCQRTYEKKDQVRRFKGCATCVKRVYEDIARKSAETKAKKRENHGEQ